MSSHTHIRLVAGLVLAVLTGGCAAAADSGGGIGKGAAGDVPSEANDALRKMADHEIEEARDIYADIASQPEYQAYGSAGVAISDTLLLPGARPVDKLVKDHFGGRPTGGDVIDAQRIIYQEDGYLDLLSRGVRWETRSDTGGVDGIKQRITSRLPWEESRLDSAKTFTEGLDKPLDKAIPTLLKFGNHISGLEDNIENVLNADERVAELIVPGETFYDRKLTLKLGKSELAVVAAGLAALRGLFHYAAAYRWDWSLERAYRTYPKNQPNDEQPDGWTDFDDTLQFLDGRLLRKLADDRSAQLDEARTAFKTSLSLLQRAIELGLDHEDGTLRWNNVDPEYARKIKTFLGDLEKSLSTRTPLSYTEPSTTADFSPLFEDGRSLPDETDWLKSETYETSSGTDVVWQIRTGAFETMFVDGIFEPGFDVDEGNGPDLTIGGDRFYTFFDNLTSPTRKDFGDVFLRR
ncbi:MAG: hypothetical protein ABEN55_21465 [Bradymonadaceae bacterium]